MITTDNSQTLANALAEIKRLEAEIQRQREKHRRTWRQLEQATHWLQVAADTLDDLQPGSALEQQIRATLSQQTEPIKPAPAQDARTTLAEALASAEWPNVSIGNKALIMRAIELLTRPAQTAPQPEQRGIVAVAEINREYIGDLRLIKRTALESMPDGTKLYAALPATPSPATAPSHE